MSQCCFLPKAAPCYVQLGKFGDICITLIAMKHIHDEQGFKPVMLTSQEYGSILEGVSYVQAWQEPLHWCNDVSRARAMATRKYGWAILPKWWDDPDHLPPPRINGDPTTTLNIGGRTIEIPAAEWDSYQLSQWRAMGFTPQQMIDWPLVFDRRNRMRELDLVKRTFRTPKKKLLFNLFGGGSSRFGFDSEVMQLIHKYLPHFEIVNLAGVRANRIFDLLGLYERSAGLITSDTSTLHLAGACEIPYVAYIANGGGGSIPKGNCQLAIRYGETINRLDELKAWIQTRI